MRLKPDGTLDHRPAPPTQPWDQMTVEEQRQQLIDELLHYHPTMTPETAAYAKSDQVRMARDVAVMFDELKALADKHAALHADQSRLQAELEQARAELARARQPKMAAPACYPRHVRRGEPRTGCGIPATVIGLAAGCGLAEGVGDPVAACCFSRGPKGWLASGAPAAGHRARRG
jgi:hypothetical protein